MRTRGWFDVGDGLVRIYTIANCSTVNHHRSSFITTFTSSPLGRYVPFPSLLLFSRERENYHGNAISTLPVSLTVKCILYSSTELRIFINQLTTTAL
jgi:hypothetical protein